MEGGRGLDGSKQGQIQTPMNKTNVQNKGDGGTHDYSKAVGNISDSGGGASSIAGPGAKGNWDACEKISGSNLKGKY